MNVWAYCEIISEERNLKFIVRKYYLTAPEVKGAESNYNKVFFCLDAVH